MVVWREGCIPSADLEATIVVFVPSIVKVSILNQLAYPNAACAYPPSFDVLTLCVLLSFTLLSTPTDSSTWTISHNLVITHGNG